jgi:hypothetical protein
VVDLLVSCKWRHWLPPNDVIDFRHFGWQIKNSQLKAIMASKQDCGTDCGSCFCLSILKNYNDPQLCSSHPKWRIIFDDTSSCKTWIACSEGRVLVLSIWPKYYFVCSKVARPIVELAVMLNLCKWTQPCTFRSCKLASIGTCVTFVPGMPF